MLNFGASKPRVRGGARAPGAPPGSAPVDFRCGSRILPRGPQLKSRDTTARLRVTSTRMRRREKRCDLDQFGPIFTEATLAALVKLFCCGLVKIGPNCQRSAEICHIRHPFS